MKTLSTLLALFALVTFSACSQTETVSEVESPVTENTESVTEVIVEDNEEPVEETESVSDSAPAAVSTPVITSNEFLDNLDVSFKIDRRVKLEGDKYKTAKVNFTVYTTPEADFRVFCTEEQNVLNVSRGSCSYTRPGYYEVYVRAWAPNGESREYARTKIQVGE